MLNNIRKVFEDFLSDTVAVIEYGDSLLCSLALKLKSLITDRMFRLVLVYLILTILVFFSIGEGSLL